MWHADILRWDNFGAELRGVKFPKAGGYEVPRGGGIGIPKMGGGIEIPRGGGIELPRLGGVELNYQAVSSILTRSILEIQQETPHRYTLRAPGVQPGTFRVLGECRWSERAAVRSHTRKVPSSILGASINSCGMLIF